MKNLFAYGTLMCKDIMEEISGCRLTSTSGILRGCRRRPVRGERYPALVFAGEGFVEGVVYRNLPLSAWERLDRFEGEMYSRQPVQIELEEGTVLPAETYVARPEFLDHLEESDWDFEDFLCNGKKCFQRQYRESRKA